MLLGRQGGENRSIQYVREDLRRRRQRRERFDYTVSFTPAPGALPCSRFASMQLPGLRRPLHEQMLAELPLMLTWLAVMNPELALSLKTVQIGQNVAPVLRTEGGRRHISAHRQGPKVSSMFATNNVIFDSIVPIRLQPGITLGGGSY